ncbi:2'-5' RNA ligase family protein [Pedobacter rhizosphaerae]|uniref:2'-5' RNA ligase n=1 Tax=Pedobacter rhizosphaerae TaxID=390241 RepID=A0A1H9Q3B4_9SPHI|nr:mutarotase [Pedobacter rhizosphaerae]SER54872.1 2'-5' RNA ligase [Pedobacter rhizosphaerae]
MNLTEHYDKLYADSVAKIASENYETDQLIDSKSDNRFGITLVIRPDEHTKNNIQTFLTELKNIDPNQYFYTNEDIHITLMSIISCYDGFNVNDILIDDYIKLIKVAIGKQEAFKIQFKGITASPSCILIQGFLTETLNEIRDKLRFTFKNATLQQSIDTRYTIQTAHSTVVRFRKALQNIPHFLQVLEKYRDFDFGTFEVKKIELVHNDWYQRAEFVRKLYDFELSEPHAR